MKYNKIFIALSLCAAMQPNMNFGNDVLQPEGPSPVNQSYWQQYAPQFMQDTSNYISKKTTNLYTTINNWSTQKKLTVAGTILTALAAIYNRDQIIRWVNDILSQESLLMGNYKALIKEQAIADNELWQKWGGHTPRELKKWGQYTPEAEAAWKNQERLRNERAKIEKTLEAEGVNANDYWKVAMEIFDQVRQSLKK
jgi:hypothetical protein